MQEAGLKLQELQIKIEQEKAKLEGILIENQIKTATGEESLRQMVKKGEETKTPIPERAEGGPVYEDQPYLVGEEGPEVMVPKQDGMVIPNYGLRENGTPKGKGWLGELPMQDGSNKVATELSIGVDFDGKETLIPSIVPTLNQEELTHLLSGGEPTPEIINKAVEHARQFISIGKSPFVD